MIYIIEITNIDKNVIKLAKKIQFLCDLANNNDTLFPQLSRTLNTHARQSKFSWLCVNEERVL